MAEQHICAVALVVRDYDEAKAWYCQVLGFDVVEDILLAEGKRWILVAPPGARESRLLLAKSATKQQSRRVGNQTGGRVFLFLRTDNFKRDYDAMREKGVRFCEEPRHESYGTVAVFEDLYGNRWDLLESK
ncbi:MAG TPA: VOC family protein [Terracidiphilus sp.]|jgi:catechol 2,3-dioxygenase-like lactoylglutathione lyase family enzyme|nr:VOC family protein [Terracidiphilus sp.]